MNVLVIFFVSKPDFNSVRVIVLIQIKNGERVCLACLWEEQNYQTL